MKRIALISTSKIFAQCFMNAIKSFPDLIFDTYMILNPSHASLDTDILKIDTVLIDMTVDLSANPDDMWSFCEKLHLTVPKCKIMLMIPQLNEKMRDIAMGLKMQQIVDDYVFADSSLDYLLTKLITLSDTKIDI